MAKINFKARLNMTEEQKRLAQECIDIEKQIMEVWDNSPSHCPINNEDWTDAHQEYLEAQWEKRDLNEQYIEAQKAFFAAMDEDKTLRTASQYYKHQKNAEKAIKEYNDFKHQKLWANVKNLQKADNQKNASQGWSDETI